MMSQDVQTATQRVKVSQEQSTEGMLLDAIARSVQGEAIAKLQDFIALRPDAREVRKALAVKLVYQGY
jgi:putative transposase